MKKILLFILSVFTFACNNKTISTDVLHRFAAYKHRFRFFFLIRENWSEATFEEDRFYNVKDKKIISNLTSYVISYRNGTLAFENRAFEFYPDEVMDMETTEQDDIVFRKEELITGNHLCEISFAPSPIFKDSAHYFETTIRNTSNQKFKVLKFGGFSKINTDTFLLFNFTHDYFTASDFNNWYMDTTDLWISPNESVSDPINYGGEMNNWAYQFQTESGEIFWAGKLN